MDINQLVQLSPEEIIGGLESYQQDIVNALLKATDNNYIESADRWLSASPTNTVKFGGDSNHSSLYREKVIEEIEKFICGNDTKYEEERKKLSANSEKTQQYVIGVISTAIGGELGVAGAFIAPVIVLIIISISKMCINAWCEMRKEMKTKGS